RAAGGGPDRDGGPPRRTLRVGLRVPHGAPDRRPARLRGGLRVATARAGRALGAPPRDRRARPRLPPASSVPRHLPDRLRRQRVRLPLPRLPARAALLHVRPARGRGGPAGGAPARLARAGVTGGARQGPSAAVVHSDVRAPSAALR